MSRAESPLPFPGVYISSLQIKITLVYQALLGGPLRYYYGPLVLREYPVSCLKRSGDIRMLECLATLMGLHLRL